MNDCPLCGTRHATGVCPTPFSTSTAYGMVMGSDEQKLRDDLALAMTVVERVANRTCLGEQDRYPTLPCLVCQAREVLKKVRKT